MSELTERYVRATLRTIPERQKADIEAELRASIDDAVEAKVADRATADEAEKEVLAGLGDPDRLAAGYTGRPGYLIGPEHFFDYKRLLTVLLITVIPVVMAVTVIGRIIAGDSVGDVVVGTIGTGVTLMLHVAFWTTLVFAIIEWSGEKPPTSDWTLSSLPPLPTTGTVRLGETIGSVVFLVFAIVAISLSRSVSPVTTDDGAAISFFDPALWDFWFPYFIVVLALEIIFEVVKYVTGRWTWGLASVNVALNALFAIPAIYLLTTERIFNPVFFEEIGWGAEPGGDSAIVVVTIVVIVIVAMWDIVDGFRKARH